MAPRTLLSVCLALAFLSACDAARFQASSSAITSTTACTRCHGNGADPAPPRSTSGETSTTAIGVGAHQAHLKDGALHRAFACSECHVVPTDLSHIDGDPKLTFGPTANAQGTSSTWDRSTATCATYCHGATLPGGALTRPVWTAGPSQAACGSCHGLPPPAPHPQGVPDCGACHDGYSATSVNLALHVNGRVDLSSVAAGGGSCTSCHGDPTRAASSAAPPRDTLGNTATTAPGVGAHQSHLFSTLRAGAVACGECHVVPTDTAHSTAPVTVTFGALATTGGATPAWSASALTCATTYCHGATLGGGSATTPLWTKVDGSQKTCGSCHGAPPPAPHAQSTDCGSCHAGYTSTSVNPATHLDGKVDVAGGALSCTSCHGDPTRAANAAAPPVDTQGNTATTAPGVGAHQSHLTSTLRAGAVACGDCHVVPTSTSHSNGVVNVTFGGAATMNGQVPTWSATSLTCATTACHASALTSGGTARTPLWTKVDGSQKTCGSCHGAPPSSGHHSTHAGRSCGDCHGASYTTTAVDPALHVDGRIETGNQITSFVNGTCTNACHSSRSW